jgi:prepilin-type processing-associated H-X9-DG protein
MKKKAGKAKAGRKRVAVKDLAAKKGGAKGGIGLLLPAVQKVREAAAHPGGVNVVMADGSVRFIKDSISQ